jgi:hypothetical protein
MRLAYQCVLDVVFKHFNSDGSEERKAKIEMVEPVPVALLGTSINGALPRLSLPFDRPLFVI